MNNVGYTMFVAIDGRITIVAGKLSLHTQMSAMLVVYRTPEGDFLVKKDRLDFFGRLRGRTVPFDVVLERASLHVRYARGEIDLIVV